MFHAHPEFHSIKKESIGLIEAQGLFILSGRLEEQLCEIENIIKDQKRGYTHPLSGFLFCADCGGKMKLNSIVRNGKVDLNFNCGNHARLGIMPNLRRAQLKAHKKSLSQSVAAKKNFPV